MTSQWNKLAVLLTSDDLDKSTLPHTPSRSDSITVTALLAKT
jgi:hypothetical protein